MPEGDLFRSIRHGDASVVTGVIDTFTPTGIRLTTGEELAADIVVTATGLNVLALGGVSLVVDGSPVKLSETVGYKGMMFSGVPNLAASFGYTNASWTLKCDLICSYVCRLLTHMERTGTDIVTPTWTEPALPTGKFIDLQSGYVLRGVDEFPKQGDEAPWRVHQNYLKDRKMLGDNAQAYDGLAFTRRSATQSLAG